MSKTATLRVYQFQVHAFDPTTELEEGNSQIIEYSKDITFSKVALSANNTDRLTIGKVKNVVGVTLEEAKRRQYTVVRVVYTQYKGHTTIIINTITNTHLYNTSRHGDEDRIISVLKLDVEGEEFPSVPQMLRSNMFESIDQVHVEVISLT